LNSPQITDSLHLLDAAEGADPLHVVLLERWQFIAAATVLAGGVTLGITFLIPPTYTARTSFISPQPQSSAAAAMASLGALANLAGSSSAIKNQADQFISLMQSATISDNIIDKFDLMNIYESKFRSMARKQLSENVRIVAGKKDGLIYIEVDDTTPQRSSDIANAYVSELRRVTGTLALTEAQQRRTFFENQLRQTKERLKAAQLDLQGSGFSVGDLKAEPKAAAESYARLKAEQTTAEVRLQTLRSSLADGAPEVRRAQATLTGLTGQLAKLETAGNSQLKNQDSYVSKYRDYKYEEALFDIFARQYELAKSDESREGTLIQVIDPAMPPDRRTKPRRTVTSIGGALAGLLISAAAAIIIARRKYKFNKAS